MSDSLSTGTVRVIIPDHRSRVRIVEVDGLEVRTTSRDAVKVAHISDGDMMSSEGLEDVLTSAESSAATKRAYRLLEHRERSQAQLHQRLLDDGYPDQVSRAVTERFADTGLVDDVRFTQAYVRTKSAARWGRDRIARGLAAAGIDGEVAATELDALLPIGDEVRRAVDLLPDFDPDDRRAREKLMRRLVARGFTYSATRDALSSKAEQLKE